MRVIVAGGRDFNNYTLLKEFSLNVFRKLKSEGYDTSKEKVTIISGTAKGADTLGERFQQDFELILEKFPADWNSFGKRAGHIRNAQMATYSKKGEQLPVLISFWDGNSRGTKDMIEIAKEKGLRVFICRY